MFRTSRASLVACLVAGPVSHVAATTAASGFSQGAVIADSCEGDDIALLQTSSAFRHEASPPKKLVATSEVAKAAGAADFWPSGRGAQGQFGWSSSLSGPFDLKLAWSWHHPEGRFHTLTYGTAVDAGGNIFLSAADAIRKFSPNGQLLWEHKTLPAQMPNAASLADGRVYSSDTTGRVFALSMETGQELWSTKVCHEIAQDNGFVTVSDGVVVAATDAANAGEENVAVRGFSASDGALLWTYKPDVNVWNFMGSPTGDGSVLFQDQAGKAYRLRLRDGSLLWKAGGSPGSWTDGTASLGANGVFYTPHNDLSRTSSFTADTPGHLSARNASDGALLWSITTPRPPNNAPALGKVYGHPGLSVVQPMGQQVMKGAPTDVYAYDAATGATRWVFRGPAQKGFLQAGDMDGSVIRLASGVRPVCLPNPWSAPTIDASGTVYVGNQDGLFFGLRDLNGDGVVEGPGEVSSFDTRAAFSGSAGPSLAPGRVLVASCDSLFVFGDGQGGL